MFAAAKELGRDKTDNIIKKILIAFECMKCFELFSTFNMHL
jgi:hypothetical protein